MIKTKCVTSPMDRKKDGLRVLVTRYWPHGLRKNRCDVWMPNLAPSEGLLRDAGKISWSEFSRRYRGELFEKGSNDKRNKLIKNKGQKFTLRMLKALSKRLPITLMCYCAEDQDQCHRHVLSDVLHHKV